MLNFFINSERKKYVTFFEKSVDAMLIIEEYNFVDCNNAALKLLNYDDKSEMINVHPSKLSPEYQPDGKKSYDKAKEMMDIAYRTGAHIFEWVHKKKDGSEVPVEVSLTAISPKKPRILHTIWRDISRRKKIEHESDKLKEELLRSQKMEAIGLMASGVAHDLNNILTGIVTYPEVLLYDMPTDHPMRKSIEIIRDSGKRAAAIVADLLTVARGIAAPRKVTDLNVIINDYLSSAEYFHLKKINSGVTVNTTLASEPLFINCSEIHIRKTIMNLFTNAFEAVNCNGIISIETKKEYFEKPTLTANSGEYASFYITDNGLGIPKEDINRIFEPFYTKKFLGKSGTGLGLSIVWNTVNDHRGFIDVDTNKNGTTFSLHFPLFDFSNLNKKNIIQKGNYTGNNEKILIIEDEEIQRNLLSDILITLNYEPFAVSSGEDAIKFLKNNYVDLIILDMLLGTGMNGRETYEKISEFNPGQKAIIVSGFSNNLDVEQTMNLGASAFISKPYDIKTIAKNIFEALHG